MKGIKHDQQKPLWHLLPMDLVEAVVRVMTFGAAKYKEGNWKYVKRGHERYYSAALRHLAAINRGELKDPETGESHFAHAICSLLFSWWHLCKK